MAWCLFGAKPLSESMTIYCQFYPKEHISMKYFFEIQKFSFMKMYLKTSSAKWRPYCLGLTLLNITGTCPKGQCVNTGNVCGETITLVSKPHRGWTTKWWRHQMETFSALLAICAGNSPVTGEFPTQRPVTRSFDVFFDLRLYKRLSRLNTRKAGDVRRHRIHYDVSVIKTFFAVRRDNHLMK